MKILLPLLAVLLPWSAWAAPRSLTIDAKQSHIEVAVKATVDSFTGRLDSYEAEVGIDPATGRVVSAAVRFHFLDFKTGKDGRDRQMHVWQDSPHHPDAVFLLTELSPVAGGGYRAKGTLQFHDVIRPLEFPVRIVSDQVLYAITGEVDLDTREFGLPVIHKFGLLKVDPVVQVRFTLQGKLPPAS